MDTAPYYCIQMGFSAAVKTAVACAIIVLFGAPTQLVAEKTLIYDEEKGIIFVDKDQAAAAVPAEPAGTQGALRRGAPGTRPADTSLIRGKKKDPSGVYFETALQYFKAGNYQEALRLFLYADSTDPQPKYSLWIGKTYRQLGKGDRLLFIMKRILDAYPESDVADDALFEIAFHYQITDDYEKAMQTYTQLAEQYPFGTSFSNGENFRDIAKNQKQMMRGEIISTLKLLGYQGGELDELYGGFQKAQRLPVTGRGDQNTVRGIKAAYAEFLKKEEMKTARRVRVIRYMNWGWALSGLLLVSIGVMVGIRAKAKGQRKQMSVLSQTLADMSVSKREFEKPIA
jgi:tetratricopeptide (TPR) repeat protein